jgi:hypothetical protein
LSPGLQAGQPVFGPATGTTAAWFNPAAFSTPAAYTFGNAGRKTAYGPGMETLDPALFVSTPQFGTIAEASTPGRELQLGARLSF